MGYINNGISRSLLINVYKWVGGNPVQGYDPRTYNGQNSWGNPLYPTLTDTQARQLSDVDYAARLAAYQAYIESVEAGSDFSTDVVGDGPTKTDPSCLPTTTTTTTEALPTTTTTTTVPVSTTTTTLPLTVLNLFINYIGGVDSDDGLKGNFNVGTAITTIPDFTKNYYRGFFISSNDATRIILTNITYWLNNIEEIKDYRYKIDDGAWVSSNPQQSIYLIPNRDQFLNVTVEIFL